MSLKSAADDLSLRARVEEPIRASNAGMNFALILTLVFSLALVIFAIASAPNIKRSTTADSTRDTTHVTTSNGKNISSTDDKSFVDGTAVQSDAITSNSSSQSRIQR